MISQQSAVQEIDTVIEDCRASELATPDRFVKTMIDELEEVRIAVEGQWPLPRAIADQLSIGPRAAKNLSDWNEPLFGSLASLQQTLKTGEKSAAPAGEPASGLAQGLRRADEASKPFPR